MDIELTKTQSEVYDRIIELYNEAASRNRLRLTSATHLLVTGSAGTGKSTSVFQAIRDLVAKGARVMFVAPTHNAVGVVSKISMKWNLQGNVEFSTLASALNLKPIRRGTKTVFIQRGEPNWAESADIVLIDEVSQIGKEYFDYIQAASERVKLVIYLGDRYQLPPVSEHKEDKIESIVFRSEFEEKQLTEVMRYAGDTLIVANKIRDVMEVGIADLLSMLPEESELIECINFAMVKERYAEMVAQGLYAKVLAYRNQTVDAINAKIHEHLGFTEYFEVGSTVVNLNPILHASGLGIPIETRMEILEATTKEFRCSMLSSKLDGLAFEYTDIRVRTQFGNEIVLMALSQEQKEAFDKVKKIIANKAKDDDPNLWRSYYYIDEKFIPCRHPYATTIHKSQGDTYDQLILALPDLGACRDALTYNKLLYTAFTRSAGKILVVTG